MTELPPIIERLDAELRDVEREFDGGTDEQIAPVWMRYGLELRALVLRLQEERDNYRGQVQMAKREFDTLREEADALLETLKDARDHALEGMTTNDRKPSEWIDFLNTIQAEADEAIANVEGKE